jgi:hypothetical protein
MSSNRAGASVRGWRTALVLATGVLVAASTAQAEQRLIAGGYAGNTGVLAGSGFEVGELVSRFEPGRALADRRQSAGGLSLDLDDAGAFVSYFTPRLGGVRVGFGRTGLPTLDGDGRQVGFGVDYRHSIAGLEVGLGTGGGIDVRRSDGGPRRADSELRTSFVVGGMLTVPDFGYGPVSARLAYGVESGAQGTPSSSLSLSADMAVRPGVAVTGRVQHTEELDRAGSGVTQGDTRGLFGLRLRF